MDIPVLFDRIQIKKEQDILNFVTDKSKVIFDYEIEYYMLKTPLGWKIILPDNWIVETFEHEYYVFTDEDFNNYYE